MPPSPPGSSTVSRLGRPSSIALVDRDRRGRRDGAELAQVAAERRGGGAGGRVLDDAAGRERVAGAEAVGALAVDELDRRPVAGGHQRAEAVEVVVELGEPLRRGGGEHGVVRARVGDARRDRRVEVGAGPAQRGQQLVEVGVGQLRARRRDARELRDPVGDRRPRRGPPAWSAAADRRRSARPRRRRSRSSRARRTAPRRAARSSGPRGRCRRRRSRRRSPSSRRRRRSPASRRRRGRRRRARRRRGCRPRDGR